MSVYPQLTSKTDLRKAQEEVKVIVGGKAIKVYSVQVTNGKVDLDKALTVLFLHGGKYSSQNWLDIETLWHVANWGYRAIAVDLPGKGKSPDAIEHDLYGDFLSALVNEMEMTNLVVVSPSSSGKYAISYLFKDPETSTDKAVGFIPIAPGGTQGYEEKFRQSMIPTLILYGEADPAGIPTLVDLTNLPIHQVATIADAGHACYLDDPVGFHTALHLFLKQVAV